MTAREGELPIIARRKTYDGKTVLAWADGYVTYGSGMIITKQMPRDAMNLFMGDVSLYDSDETKMLAAAARKAVRQYPDSTILARQYMRRLAGPPLKSNPISPRDWIFIGTGVVSMIAILYELSKKMSTGSSSLPAGASGSTPDQVASYDGQVINLTVGQSISAQLIFSPPQAGWRVSDTTGDSILAADSTGLVTTKSMVLQRWTAVAAGSETVEYQAIDSSGNDIVGTTLSFTANASASVS
jgi:hypothetical protein